MKTRSVKPATADLFVEQRVADVRGLAPMPFPHTRPPLRQLWYAVVFAESKEPPANLQGLGLLAQQFTPLVSIDLPNALLLEIKGSVHLFGSLIGLTSAIDAAWERCSLRVCSAVAPTTLAALWCARAGKRACIEDAGQLTGTLADLPVACTSWDPAWLQTLQSMGVTRLAELLRLPRAGVARRLSPAAIRDLDIALGRQAAPRRAFIPPERFRERSDFEMEIETVLYLQKALAPVVDRCAQFLRKRQAGIQALQLKLHHRLTAVSRVRVGLASITGEHRRLAAVLDERLERLVLAAPVKSVELSSGPLLPLPRDSLDAFAGSRTGDTAPQLVERLRARLGERAVYGVVPIADHRPEAAWQRIHALRLPTVHGRGVQVPEMPRPLWLLDEPVLLGADLERLHRQGVVLEQGPERIESGWWDGKDVMRDYYRARHPRGAQWWVFQERRSRCWYWHGVFA